MGPSFNQPIYIKYHLLARHTNAGVPCDLDTVLAPWSLAPRRGCGVAWWLRECGQIWVLNMALLLARCVTFVIFVKVLDLSEPVSPFVNGDITL